ncbi:hypothetical protein evm_011452 [Chilo suppressalis]|nr:hypothetical protein evm_011452 [Chilo suppressalis]
MTYLTMYPDVNVHGIDIDFEPISGTPMVANQRMMFSLVLQQIDKLDLFKDLPGTMTPLFWIEEHLSARCLNLKKSVLEKNPRGPGSGRDSLLPSCMVNKLDYNFIIVFMI